MNPKRRTAQSDAGLEAAHAMETGLSARQEKNALCVNRATHFKTHKITHHRPGGGV
jgi:hypothetical protein